MQFDYFHLETFDDHALNTPGVVAIGGGATASFGFNGSVIDKVGAAGALHGRRDEPAVRYLVQFVWLGGAAICVERRGARASCPTRPAWCGPMAAARSALKLRRQQRVARGGPAPTPTLPSSAPRAKIAFTCDESRRWNFAHRDQQLAGRHRDRPSAVWVARAPAACDGRARARGPRRPRFHLGNEIARLA